MVLACLRTLPSALLPADQLSNITKSFSGTPSPCSAAGWLLISFCDTHGPQLWKGQGGFRREREQEKVKARGSGANRKERGWGRAGGGVRNSTAPYECVCVCVCVCVCFLLSLS
eukprot:Sspe_Gene.63755::Locus_36904_Transcript_2_8_Confidence_0.115_Length_1452::g.63755::m.63755